MYGTTLLVLTDPLPSTTKKLIRIPFVFTILMPMVPQFSTSALIMLAMLAAEISVVNVQDTE